MPDSPKAPEDESTELGWRGPSRSQKKRDSKAVTEIGVTLTKLGKNQLAKVPLDDDLREEILACHDMTKGALARQLRFIGRQLNEPTTDLEGIKNVLREMRLLRE